VTEGAFAPVARRTGRVVVVGGGLAGLAAAVRLAARGREVLVLEARGVLGGRTTSIVDPATSLRIDNGQHVVMGCYAATFDWLDAMGARANVWLQPSLEVTSVDRAGVRSTLRCPPWRAPLNLLAGVLAWRTLPARERIAVLRLAPALRRARHWVEGRGPAPVVPGETVGDWLARHGQGPRLRELLWEPLALAALNQDVATSAAGPFVRVLAGIFGPGRQDASIGLPVGRLDEAFAEPARRFVEERGGLVRRHAPARVHVERGQVTRVTVRDETVTERPEAVVVAVPWHALEATVVEREGLLAPLFASERAREASPIVTVNLWFDRPVLETAFVGLPGRRFQWAFDKGRDALGRWHVSLVASGAAAVVDASQEALAATAEEELLGAMGVAAKGAARVAALIVREPRATFSLAPGQPPRPAPGTPVRGLYLAGDWTGTGLPATIEGAVVSGHRAADLVLSGAAVESPR